MTRTMGERDPNILGVRVFRLVSANFLALFKYGLVFMIWLIKDGPHKMHRCILPNYDCRSSFWSRDRDQQWMRAVDMFRQPTTSPLPTPLLPQSSFDSTSRLCPPLFLFRLKNVRAQTRQSAQGSQSLPWIFPACRQKTENQKSPTKY